VKVSTNEYVPQVVFIDSRVPDIQGLLEGLQPGEQAFVIDPSSDGIQQIADILAANNFTDLASISIVSHGESGELELGSTLVGDGDLAARASALAEIGAALAPAGTIQLFGCDVAQGSTGQQFINDFSTFAGGVQVDAATHIVGSASLGGSWTLDAASGAAPAPTDPTASSDAPTSTTTPSTITAAPPTVATPFTSSALANFQGALAVPVPLTTGIWFVTAGAAASTNSLDDANNPLSDGTVSNQQTLFAAGATHAFVHLSDVALDTQDGLFFAIDSSGQGSPNVITKGTLSTALAGGGSPGLGDFTTIYSESLGVAEGGIQAMKVDVPDQLIYFIQADPDETTVSFDRVGFNGGPVTTLATIANVAFVDMSLDLTAGNAYITAISSYATFGGTIVGANQIYDISGISPTASTVTATPITINGSVNFPTSLGVLDGVAIDTLHQVLYFTTDPTQTNSNGGIFFYDLTGNPSHTFGTLFLEPSGTGGLNSTSGTPFSALGDIEVDPTTGLYYVSDSGKEKVLGISDNSIYVGGLVGGSLSTTPTHFLSVASGAAIEGMFLDNAPTLTITPTSPTFTESTLNPASAHNTPVAVLTSDVDSDSDNTKLDGATVSISGFFAGDTLTFSNNHNIVGNYNASTGVLTFTGEDTFTDYQTALQSVQFTSTSDNPTNYGSDTSRVLSFTINDGLLNSTAQTETVTVVGVNDPPTLSGVAAASFTEKGGAKTLSSGAAVSDPDSLTLASATVAIVGGTFANDGDVLGTTTTGTSIMASYNSTTETLVLSGSDTLAHYQSVLDEITFNSTSLNPDNFGSNTTRTVTWVLNDGAGSFNTSTVISTINVTAVNDPPTLTGTTGTVSFTEGTPVTLSPSVTATDPDSLGLQGATVKITGGTFTNDGDVLTTSTIGTHVTAGYNASTETLTLTGSDTFADYQTVLDNVVFTSGANPDDFGSQTTRTVTWVLNDGAGSNNLSTAQTTTINVTAVNDPPVLSAVPATATYVENASQLTLASAAAVSDVDSLTLASATVQVVAGAFTGDGDVLAVNGVSNGTIQIGSNVVTISYDSSTETLRLTGSDTIAHYQTLIDEVSFRSSSDNPTDFGADPTRTLTWLLNDGAASNNLSAVTTSTIDVTAVNDPPTLTVATSASFTENTAAITLSPSVTVNDPDNTTLAGATIRIAGGTFANDGDLLAVDTTGTAITASYDATSETLTLSGTDTLADYRQVLQSVTFVTPSDNPTDFGANPTRTITWVLDDGSGSSNLSAAATTTISITAINDPPTLANVASSAAYTELGAAAVLSSTLAVVDPDSVDLSGATVQITGGIFAGDGDVLTFNTSGTSVTASYNAATETLTLSGSDTLAHYQSVLDSVAFSSTSHDPTNAGADTTRTVTWLANDGSGASNLSTVQTTTVSITAVNDPPTLAGTTNASFTENTAAVTLSPNVTVSDPDSVTLAGATVQITGGTFGADGDVLGFSTVGTSISASYNAATETLTLSGSDTLAHYRSVLDSVTFVTASDNPDNFGADPTRTVTWVLNDGAGSNNLSTVQTSTIGITAINDAPTLSAIPANATVAVGQTVTLAATAAVADPDNLDLASATVTITGGTFTNDGDVLGFDTTGTTISASYDAATETLTLTGADTLAHYQSVLDSITFSSTAADPTNGNANPTRTLSWTVDDGALASTAQTETLTIQNGPAINPPAHAAFTENQAPPTTLAPSLVVTDSNVGASITGATVALTGGTFAGDGDILNVNGAAGNLFVNGASTITVSYDTVTETLTLSGTDTLADYTTALDNITFTTASDNPTEFGADPTRTVTWTITDSNGSNNTGSAVSTIDVTAVNDPPTLATVAANASFTEGNGAVVLSNAVSVSDPDNLDLASATVSITAGTFAGDGDRLAVDTTGTAITASYNSTTETLTLTGSDTLADYQQVLDTLTFDSTSHNPDDFGADPSRQVTWVLNDGSGSSNLSAPATTTVAITAVNDPPTITAAATDSFVTGQTLTLSPSLSVSDPDNLTLASATVSITAGGFAGDVLAANTAGTSISASYDSTSETLTLTGSDTIAHYQQVLDSVTFSSTAADPTDANANPTRAITWAANDGSGSNNLSTAQTTTVDLALGPAILVPANAAFTEQQVSPVTLSASIALSDSNSGASITGATVAISPATFLSGDVLADADAFGITGSYDSSTGVLTLSGTDSLAHYQQVLDSVTFTTPGDNPDDFGADPTRTVTWTVTDGSGGAHTIGTATSTINVTAVNDPPTFANLATGAQFTEGGGAVVLSGSASVVDPDNLDLAGATVSITTGKFTADGGDGDVLSAVTAGTSITASYDSTTEVLVLSGTDTLAHYTSVLDSVTFNSTSLNPTDFGAVTTHQVTWQLNDGSGSLNLSTPATATVTLTAVNNPPTVTGQAAHVAFTVGNTVTLSPSLTVTDLDSLTVADATVKITGGTFAGDGDKLAATAFGNVTVSYDQATETLALTGSDTLANYQSVLDSVTFTSTSTNPNNGGADPTRTITWVVDDGSGSSNFSSPVTTTVDLAHEPPSLTNVASTVSFTQGNVTDLSPAITVTDFDSATLASATVKITGGTFTSDGDVLATNTAGTSISASYNAATETLTLTGVDTLAHYQSVLGEVTFQSGADPTQHGANPTRTVTWLVSDGNASQGLSQPATSTITITPLDAAPTLSNAAATASFTENGSAVTLAQNLSVSDPDSTQLTSATVSITGGTFVGDGDQLLVFDTTLAAAFTSGVYSGLNITYSYDSTSETLTLTGADTLADYRHVLQNVEFVTPSDNPTDFGADPRRTITWTVADDFNVHSAAATTTVNVAAVNDAPTLSGVAATVGFIAGTTVQLAPTLTVSDADSLDLVSATVKITGGTFANDGDVLHANTTGTHISASYDSTTETLVLTGPDPVATFQSVLKSVTFASGANPTGFGADPTRTLTWVVDDGGASNNLSATSTTTIDITAINSPPALANVPAADAFTEGQTLTLAGAAVVSDPDNLDLAGATVKIVGGTFTGDGDVLAFSTAGTSIAASYNSATETLTLSGADTLAHYQQVLDSVSFASGLNPDDFGSRTTRTVTWLLDDGSASNNLSTVQTTTVSITAINNPPTLAGTANASFTEKSAAVTLSPSVTVSDPDNLGLVGATVQIVGGTFAGDGDILGFSTSGTSISASYNAATEMLTFTGFDTFAHYAQVLDSVTFVTPSINPDDFGLAPTRTVTWTLDDGSASNPTATVTTTVGITAVNDPPTLASVAAAASFTEKGAAVTLSGNASVSDPDSVDLASATVKITGGTFANDRDQLAATLVGNITSSYNSTTETLTLTGADTLVHYQQVLDSVTFNSTSLNPTNFGADPTRTVTWLLNDGSGSNNTSALQTTTINLTAVNDAPTVSNAAANVGYTEQAAAAALSGGLSVADPDNLTLVNATVRITGGAFAGDGDVLGFNTAGTSITGSYNSATETLVFSGVDTVAHYQSVLESVTFFDPSDNPTNYGSNPSRTLTWVVNDGSASNNLSTPQTTTVNITAVNDPPTLANVPSVEVFHPGQTLTLDPTLALSDPDSLTLANATVKITGGTFPGDGDQLGFNTGGTAIAASYNAATETLTLSGSDTVAHYQQVLDSITLTSGANPANSGLNLTRTLSWTVNDGSTSNNIATATTTIAISTLLKDDFNGDGTSDILWFNPSNGNVAIWQMHGTSVALEAGIGNIDGWSVVGSGDFNGDGKSDILMDNPANGNVAVWEMNGTSIAVDSGIGNIGTSSHPVATGDFNGDGKSDILFQKTDGTPVIWTMNGTAVVSTTTLENPGSNWHAVGTGDFNGDGKSDILWFNPSNGNVAIWEMNGTSVALQAGIGNISNWSVAGTGDFNGDGKSDILLENPANGNVAVWEMNGTNIAVDSGIGNIGAGSALIGTGDYNGDGKSDILFQKPDTTPVVWNMNATTVTSTTTLPTPGGAWHANTG
jgi:lipopolysaccharide export system protein LptA